MPEYKVLLSLPQEDKPNTVKVISNGTTQHTILGKIKVTILKQTKLFYALWNSATEILFYFIFLFFHLYFLRFLWTVSSTLTTLSNNLDRTATCFTFNILIFSLEDEL